MDDTKALAAQARSQTGGPVLVPNAAELSGVRPRRDSVIGARLTPPPRASGSEMPNWIWGALGCLTVLLVGFVALFVLMRSGKLDGLIGERAPVLAAAPQLPAAGSEPIPAPAAAPAPAPAPVPTEPPSRPARAPAARAPEEDPSVAPPPREPAAAAVPAPSPSDDEQPKRAAARERAAKAKAAEEAAPAAPAGEAEAEGAAAEPKAPARPARAPAVAAKAPAPAAEEEADDDQSPPGQDAVEGALDALSTKVRGCFVKYQIKGTARVRLVATPGGTPESVSVSGDFEDTPTGLCVESVVASAKLPTFKGPPLKLSQSYQLR